MVTEVSDLISNPVGSEVSFLVDPDDKLKWCKMCGVVLVTETRSMRIKRVRKIILIVVLVDSWLNVGVLRSNCLVVG